MNKRPYYVGAYSQRYRYSNFSQSDAKKYAVRVSVNDKSMGSVEANGLNGGVIRVSPGETVTLHAVPNPGFKFVGWDRYQNMIPEDSQLFQASRSLTGNKNQLTVKVDGDIDIMAVFAVDTTYISPDPAPYPQPDPEPLPSVPAPETLTDKAFAFLKKWWWALAIVAYVVYKERGGKS